MTDEQLLLRNTGCAAKRAQQVSRLTWALERRMQQAASRALYKKTVSDTVELKGMLC